MGLLDRLRGTSAPRVAVIGVDGLPYSVVADNPGVFENLHAIADEGAGGAIESAVPPAESATWPALTAGVNPGKTGVYGFTDREVGTYDTYVPMGGDVQADRIWDRATAAGRDATVLNVPVTFPPQRDVQRMVSSYLARDLESAAYPDELREYLLSIDYRLDDDPELGHEADKTAFVDDADETVARRFEAFRHYVEADDWDLFVGAITTSDRVNHFLFGDYARGGEYREAFLDFYREVDRYVGELHDLLGDDVTTVVASDHGFTGLEYEVHCNQWLREEGWLSFREEPRELADIADGARAFALSPGRFYLNLEGREPRGAVPEAEYESVRAELRAAIEGLEDPDGEPVVERVVTREEAFNGPHDDIAPDLVALPRRGYDLQGVFGTDAPTFGSGARTGTHTLGDATLVVDDPGVRIEGDVNIYDIAPTVLDLLDIDYDVGAFDGRSLA
ncbi:MAG: alkaline phosphatase family protein [Halobacteriaceae archaeon]